jgi:tetratricopeptide (TPR) repeat protein
MILMTHGHLRGVLASLFATVVLSTNAAQAKDLVVQQDEAILLSDCAEGGAEVAKLAKGQSVRLRFALAGSSNRCYSVSAEVAGHTVNGYVAREALAGLEEFESDRKEASSARLIETAIKMIGLHGAADAPDSAPADTPEQQAVLLRAAAELKSNNPAGAERILAVASLPADHPTVALLRANALMQLSRPGEARKAVEPALRRHPANAQLLAMAGMSSFQLDDMRAAEAYLKKSLSIAHNPSIEQVYARVQREVEGDKSSDKTYGSRFVLRYEGDSLAPEAARALTTVFDAEFNRISYQLGCQFNDRLVVIIQSREAYQNTTGAADWSGGRYDGRIRIALPQSGQADAFVRQAFAHETVHACLSKIAKWPSWLHEGLAQRLSGDRLDARSIEMLRAVAKQDNLPRLAQLAGGWSHFSSAQAQLAYSLSLAAIDAFYDTYHEYGLRNLMNNPSRIEEISGVLDRSLRERFQQ